MQESPEERIPGRQHSSQPRSEPALSQTRPDPRPRGPQTASGDGVSARESPAANSWGQRARCLCVPGAAGSKPPSDTSRPRLRAPTNDSNATMTPGTTGTGYVTSFIHGGPGSDTWRERRMRERGPRDNGATLGNHAPSSTGCMSHTLHDGQSSHRPRRPSGQRCHDSGDRQRHAPSHLPVQA